MIVKKLQRTNVMAVVVAIIIVMMMIMVYVVKALVAAARIAQYHLCLFTYQPDYFITQVWCL